MAKKVLLLTNLGSPDSTSVRDVRTYLKEFLMDERVIDVPYIGRLLLVRGIIVPFRSPKSAEKYKTIWTKEGSPLIVITKELVQAVEGQTDIPTYMCMRYANPTPKATMDKIVQDHPDVEEVIMVPLYPHYAMSSYETAVLHVENTHKQENYSFKLKVVQPYYDAPHYIDALADSIQEHIQQEMPDYQHLLFSYHGVPERHILKSDPTKEHCLKCENCCDVPADVHDVCYRHQIKVTTELVAKKLGLDEEKYSFCFQSRLGRDKWLEPFTTARLKALPGEGVKNLVVVCPAFVSDCLETLEEICEEGEEDYLEAGGEKYTVVPCLNTNDLWVQSIEKLVQDCE